jgi:hypothetical protein
MRDWVEKSHNLPKCYLHIQAKEWGETALSTLSIKTTSSNIKTISSNIKTISSNIQTATSSTFPPRAGFAGQILMGLHKVHVSNLEPIHSLGPHQVILQQYCGIEEGFKKDDQLLFWAQLPMLNSILTMVLVQCLSSSFKQ